MHRNLNIILFLCILFNSSMLMAQTEVAKPRYAISLEPFYLCNGGLRLNLEKKLQSNNWMEVNLSGYSLPHSDMQPSYSYGRDLGGHLVSNADFTRISGLKGLGIGGSYKHYFYYPFFFVNSGINYTWYKVESPLYDYVLYQEDGLNYYDYTWTYKHQQFHKLTAQVALGLRTSSKYQFFLEHFVGLGYAYSFHDNNQPNYSKTMLGYGYRGLYLTIGLKIGLNIR